MRLSLLLMMSAALLGSSHFPARKAGSSKGKTTTSVNRTRSSLVAAGTVTIHGQTAGPTPFISEINMTVTPANSLLNIRFTIAPKPGSVTRPVSAAYSSAYLQSRGYLDVTNGQITLPVFGLYANYSNTVTVTSALVDGSSQEDTVMVATGQFTDTCGQGTPTVLQARTNDTDLSYDYIILKTEFCGSQSPVIIDTDGAIRWVGTAGVSSLSTMFFSNGFYISSFPPSSTNRTGITRMEFDGTATFLHDYADIGVASSEHHNYDPGKEGMLIEVDTSTQTESVILEVDGCGNVLKRWDLADIISAAMIAGGDDPTQFVKPSPTDWFHNNAATYRKSDDSLVVSSRENFVICLDYETSAIKWILGDPTKKWYQFPSLRQHALALGPNTLPPIGQHAVSFTSDDNLLLFDNGFPSLNQSPAGAGRPYSAPRKYQINPQTMVATEVWNYLNGQTVSSPFCSSIYEDSPLNYLVDYANAGPVSAKFARVLGLNAAGTKIFDYRYPTTSCNTAWNAIPIHLENLRFTGPDPADGPAGWQITVRKSADVLISFAGEAGKTYRLEYKNDLNDVMWQTVTDRPFQCAGTAVVTDTGTAGHPQRFYRVRLLP
jgi:arylsulfate sulfotransferase